MEELRIELQRSHEAQLTAHQKRQEDLLARERKESEARHAAEVRLREVEAKLAAQQKVAGQSTEKLEDALATEQAKTVQQAGQIRELEQQVQEAKQRQESHQKMSDEAERRTKAATGARGMPECELTCPHVGLCG